MDLILYLISTLGCIISAKYIRNDSIRVIDIVHENIPYLKMPYLSDILIFSQLLYTIFMISLKELNKIFITMTIVQFCRIICGMVTVLPPLQKYENKYRFGGLNGSGTDYIFSGHASYSALSSILLYNYGISIWLLIPYNLVSQLSIIITRNHYTVDVILAWIITVSVYMNVELLKI